LIQRALAEWGDNTLYLADSPSVFIGCRYDVV